jgi:hypothetical protein
MENWEASIAYVSKMEQNRVLTNKYSVYLEMFIPMRYVYQGKVIKVFQLTFGNDFTFPESPHQVYWFLT